MTPHEMFLLSPYQVPTHHPLMLANDDVAAFLNGYAALWHPAALRGAAGPPRVVSPYDHESPVAHRVFAVPDSPPAMLPDDWQARVRDAGSYAFRATPERESTVSNLMEALVDTSLRDLPADRVRPFMGVGFGFMMVNALYEVMEHENLLSVAEFWQDVQHAADTVTDPDAEIFLRHLRAAADRLIAARDVLYPVAIHVIDMAAIDKERLNAELPAAFEAGLPLNVVASSAVLEEFGRVNPTQLTNLREGVRRDAAEVCGGCYVEREDALLPLESAVWNLRKGLAVSRELLGAEVRVYARHRFGMNPQSPVLLVNMGLTRAFVRALNDTTPSAYQSAVVAYTSPDGRQVDGFARMPYAAHDPNTFFHLAHYLHKTIMQDHAATLALVHSHEPDAAAYLDWIELCRLGPVLGQWTTLTRYLSDVTAGEYASTMSPDEFHDDYLSERVSSGRADPVSEFATHARHRRLLDTAYTFTGFLRGVSPTVDTSATMRQLADIEDRLEVHADDNPGALETVEREMAAALAHRLVARAPHGEPGYVLLNPCGFPRRTALELPEAAVPIPIQGPVKACQLGDGLCRVVVEVPGLGFAWLPRAGPPGSPPMPTRMRLADDHHVRNEFFEAEIDPATGGLRGIRDHHTRVHRIAQQLAFNPGSAMRATAVSVASTGPALGEVTTEGTLVGEQDQLLARFRQRFRAWLGRPVLEMCIEIEPALPPAGYPWHAYFAARFAWRDERATLLRGVNGTAYVTSHTRPQTPDYLELRQGRQNTIIFPSGLPFHQLHGSRMLDVILITPNETARRFDLAIALDREHPMLTAQGLVTAVSCVPVETGPPHVGASGWLFHLDSPNLLLTSLRPASDGDAVVIGLLECGQHGGQAEMRFPRNPCRAELRDARGARLRDASVEDDRAIFDVIPGEVFYLHAEFG